MLHVFAQQNLPLYSKRLRSKIIDGDKGKPFKFSALYRFSPADYFLMPFLPADYGRR